MPSECLSDLVGKTALTPDVDLVDTSAVLADDVQERLQRRADSALVKGGVEDDHDFVWTHEDLITSYGLVGHGVSVAGGSPASATGPGYRNPADLRNRAARRLTLRPCSPRRGTRSTEICASPTGRRRRRCSRHRVRPELVHQLRGPAGAAVDPGLGRGDDIARPADLLRPARHRRIRSRRSGCDADLGAMGRQHHRGAGRSRQPRSGSRRVGGAVATAALFAAAHPSRTTALVVLEGYADPVRNRYWDRRTRKFAPRFVAMWGTGEFEHLRQSGHAVERGDPGRVGPDGTPGGEPTDRCAHVAARREKWTYGQSFRRSACRRSSSITPRTRSSRPRRAGTSPSTYPARNTLSCRGATCITSSNRGGIPSRRSPSSSPATRPKWPTIGFWPRCCSPTSWTRRAWPRRSVTATGTRCSTHTTPSSGHNSRDFAAAR